MSSWPTPPDDFGSSLRLQEVSVLIKPESHRHTCQALSHLPRLTVLKIHVHPELCNHQTDRISLLPSSIQSLSLHLFGPVYSASEGMYRTSLWRALSHLTSLRSVKLLMCGHRGPYALRWGGLSATLEWLALDNPGSHVIVVAALPVGVKFLLPRHVINTGASMSNRTVHLCQHPLSKNWHDHSIPVKLHSGFNSCWV